MQVLVVTTHPVQYQVPWIRGLACDPRFTVRVLYGMVPDEAQQGVGFGIPFRWDLPLLEGYDWSVARNRARVPSLSAFSGIDVPDVATYLGSPRPDVVIVCGWQARFLLQTARACRQLGIPSMVRGESNALRPRSWWKRLGHRLLLTRWYDGALAIGRSNRAFLESAGVPGDRIFDAPYGVDDSHLVGPLADRDVLRREARVGWGLGAESVVVLFVGKVQEKKRPLDLVDAILRVRERQPDVQLLMVGTGDLLAEVRRRASALGSAFVAAGFLNQGEIARAYAAADLLVLPSDYGETWGLVVNEAMLCGLPVVVSDRVGCGPDLVQDRDTGVVVPFGDVAALADAIGRLATCPEDRARMGENASRVVREFSIERAVQGTARGLLAIGIRAKAANSAPRAAG